MPHPPLSVIVPAYNSAGALPDVLEAIRNASPEAETIVVDDASTDDTAAVARSFGARVVSLSHNSGPAAARNRGAEAASAPILVFVDADVIIAPDALARVRQVLASGTDIAAVIGSYDDAPAANTLISRYRNLLHHHMHQIAASQTQNFWSGLGAVRREAFEAVGGFDAGRYAKPSVEDIDLGYRLSAAGYTIRLDRHILGTHLKRWSLTDMVRTDVFRRALPWTRLILAHRPDAALNASPRQQMCGYLAVLALLALPAAVFWPPALGITAASVAAVVVLNADFFRLLYRRLGWKASLCLPLHLLYYLCGVLGYALGRLEHLITPASRRQASTSSE